MGCGGAKQGPIEDTKTRGFHGSYQLVRKLGQGSHGSVYLAYSRCREDVELAVKAIELGSSSDFHTDVRTEVDILKSLRNNQHCAQFVDFFEEGGVSYIVMEKCENALPKVLLEVGELTVSVISNYVRQMLQGLFHVHTSNIVHRDIKPANFLVSGVVGRHHTVKLSDFGSAVALPGGVASAALLLDVCGTTPFCAPEMLTYAGYGTRADVWSFGVIVYLLLLGQYVYMPRPFSMQNVSTAIQEDRPAPSFKPRVGLSSAHITPAMVSFLQLLLHRDPSERPSAYKAMKHEWFRYNHQSSSGTLLGSNTRSSEVTLKGQRLPQVCLKPMLNSAEKLGAFSYDNRASVMNSFDVHLLRLSER